MATLNMEYAGFSLTLLVLRVYILNTNTITRRVLPQIEESRQLFFVFCLSCGMCCVLLLLLFFLGAVFWKPNMEQNRLSHLSTKPNDLFMEPNALNIKHLDYPACPWVTLIDVHRMPKHTVASHKCENILQCWLEVYICFSLNLIAFQW